MLNQKNQKETVNITILKQKTAIRITKKINKN